MFTVKLKNGYEFKAESVQEGLIQHNENHRSAIMLKYTSREKSNLNDVKDKIAEGMSEIKVFESENLLDTFTGCNEIFTLNRTLQLSGEYAYYIQLGK